MPLLLVAFFIMDITNTTKSRIDLGLKLLLDGQNITFHGVSFRSYQEQLIITSYSLYRTEIHKVSKQEAKKAIENSKQVYKQLLAKFSAHQDIERLIALSRKYLFCFYDEQTGILLAEEVKGKINYINYLTCTKKPLI